VSGLEILNALPVWALAAIVVGVSVVFSVGLQLLARWYFGVDLLAANHEVAGFKYAVVGVAYAVLLAFVVVSVWEEFDGTKRAVDAEAERFYNLYRNSYNFPEATGQKMRDALMAYAVAVRDKDWPQMERGSRGSEAAAKAYTRLSYTVGQTKSEDIALQPSVKDGNHLTLVSWKIGSMTRWKRMANNCAESVATSKTGAIIDGMHASSHQSLLCLR